MVEAHRGPIHGDGVEGGGGGTGEKKGELVEHQVKALVLHCTSVELTPVIDRYLS